LNLRQTQEQTRILFERAIQRGSMTNKLLAEKTKIAPTHICNFRHARRRLSVEALSRVITALGLELEIVPIRRPTSPQDGPQRKKHTRAAGNAQREPRLPARQPAATARPA